MGETTVRNNKKGGKKEERKRKEAREEGKKESDAGHSLFELAPCALRRLRCALCRARAEKRGEKKKKKMKKKKRKKETGEFRWLLRDGGSNGFWCRRPHAMIMMIKDLVP